MATVQSLILRMALRIDPFTKAGVELAAGTIGTTDGDRFSNQRRVDIWNEARTALSNALYQSYPPPMRAVAMAGLIKTKSDVTFSSGSVAKPTGYIGALILKDSAGADIPVLPASSIERTLPLLSASNPFVYDIGDSFVCLNWTSGILPNDNDYVLRYYGLDTYTTTDVSGGVTVEQFTEPWHPILLQLAEAIANEAGAGQVNQLASSLVK